MALLNATELASRLGVSRARVSQYVSEDKLRGCYIGDGRARRFDLEKVQAALQGRLDPGQMMGNGAGTRRALARLSDPADDRAMTAADWVDPGAARIQPETAPRRSDVQLERDDPDRYELARTQKAEEEVRMIRRKNAEAEGTFTLVAEVQRQVAMQMAQEIGEFEAVLRDGARQVADAMGVDFKKVRQILTDRWREHRAGRAAQLAQQAQTMGLTPDEQSEDI